MMILPSPVNTHQEVRECIFEIFSKSGEKKRMKKEGMRKERKKLHACVDACLRLCFFDLLLRRRLNERTTETNATQEFEEPN